MRRSLACVLSVLFIILCASSAHRGQTKPPAGVGERGAPSAAKGGAPAAKGGADLDALSRAVTKSDALEDLEKLYGEAFKLREWYFVARGKFPEVRPYIASNKAVASGRHMVRAFTDTDRLFRFARENGLTGGVNAGDESTSIGLAEASLVGQELGDEFEAKIEIYIQFQAAQGLSQATCGPRVSKIRKLKRFAEANFEESLRLQTLPQTFGQKLHKLIVSSGFTIKGCWRTLPEELVSYRSLLDWRLGRNYPCKKHTAVIKAIETCLEIPEGTLRFNKYLRGGRSLKGGHSDSADKSRGAMSKPYRVWTP